jgi:hypothetical protein
MWEGMRNSYTVLVIKRGGRRPPRRCRGRWEDNIKIDLEEIACECVNWCYLTQHRDHWWDTVNMVLHFKVS